MILFLLQLVWGSILFVSLQSLLRSRNEVEFNNACQKEIETIPDLIKFWRENDKQIEDWEKEIEIEYESRVKAFYEGKIQNYPGRRGPVGLNFQREFGRTVVHHVGKYYDSNLLKTIEFNVYPDGKCQI